MYIVPQMETGMMAAEDCIMKMAAENGPRLQLVNRGQKMRRKHLLRMRRRLWLLWMRKG